MRINEKGLVLLPFASCLHHGLCVLGTLHKSIERAFTTSLNKTNNVMGRRGITTGRAPNQTSARPKVMLPWDDVGGQCHNQTHHTHIQIENEIHAKTAGVLCTELIYTGIIVFKEIKMIIHESQ